MGRFRDRQALGLALVIFAAGAFAEMSWHFAALIALMGGLLLFWVYVPEKVDAFAKRFPAGWHVPDKLDRLARFLDGPGLKDVEISERMAEFLSIGTHLMQEPLGSPDDYDEWKSRLDTWVADVGAFLKKELGPAEESLFMMLDARRIVFFPRYVSDRHNDELNHLEGRLDKLRAIMGRTRP